MTVVPLAPVFSLATVVPLATDSLAIDVSRAD